MLWVLVGLIVLLVFLLLLILFLPFDFRLRLDSDWAAPTWDGQMTGAVHWLLRLRWGRVVVDGVWEGESRSRTHSSVRICGLGRRKRPKLAGDRTTNEKRKRKAKSKSRSIDLELIPNIVLELARFLARLVRDAGIGIQGEVTYGFADPAVTGWCEAFRWSTHMPVPVALEPDFTRTALTGWVQADGQTTLFRVLRAVWPGLDNPVIRGRLADRIHFGPIHKWLVRGGNRRWQTSS